MFWPFKKPEDESDNETDLDSDSTSEELDVVDEDRKRIRKDYTESLQKLNNLIDDLKSVERKHHGA